MYERKIKYENLEKYVPGISFAGKYNVPVIQPSDFCGTDFIGFHSAKAERSKSEKAVHFYLDDYRFERVWRYPEQYIDLLRQFSCVLSPDFSLFADYPTAIQIYNHYRKHWVAAYWQAQGINVIPTICWSGESSFDCCFDGEPVGATVAVSSVGTLNNANTRAAFMAGYNEMMERLKPEKIIFYGNIPDECRGNIVRIRQFSDKFKEARINGR